MRQGEATPAELASELERAHGNRAIDGLFVQVSGPKMMQVIRTLRNTRNRDDAFEAMKAKADEYRDAKRNKAVMSPEDEKWNARMDGAENALREFARGALAQAQERP